MTHAATHMGAGRTLYTFSPDMQGRAADGVGRPEIVQYLTKGERTCEALGVCQHPLRECTGACEQKQPIPAWCAPTPADPTYAAPDRRTEDLGLDNTVAAVLVAALSGATLGILYGATRWLLQVAV